MSEIEVAALDAGGYRVEVSESGSTTRHEVTVSPGTREDLGVDEGAEGRLVEESFRFLLEREPKESILASFELGVIGRYFPEYPDEIRRRMEA